MIYFHLFVIVEKQNAPEHILWPPEGARLNEVRGESLISPDGGATSSPGLLNRMGKVVPPTSEDLQHGILVVQGLSLPLVFEVQ